MHRQILAVRSVVPLGGAALTPPTLSGLAPSPWLPLSDTAVCGKQADRGGIFEQPLHSEDLWATGEQSGRETGREGATWTDRRVRQCPSPAAILWNVN